MHLLDEYRQAFSNPVLPNPGHSATSPPNAGEETRRAGFLTPNSEEGPNNAGSQPKLIDLTAKEGLGGEHSSIVQTSQFKRPRTDVGRLNEFAIRYAFLNLAADPIVIPKPFEPLFHYQKELEEYANSAERTDVERAHMRVLVDDFLKPYMGDTVIYTEEVPKGRVRYEYLWTLFRADDDVIAHNEHYREVYRALYCGEIVTASGGAFAIYIWRKWRRLINPTQMQYNGPIWTGEPSARQIGQLDIRHSIGRIMLDHEQHAEHFGYPIDQLIGVHGYRLNSREFPDILENSVYPALKTSSAGGLRPTGRSKKISLNSAQCLVNDEHYQMSDDQALLLPARTRGFSLSEKRMTFFLVERVKEVDYKEKAFDSLMLEPNLKDIVRALVEAHDPASTEFDDIVAGKGKGVIILLEGPPGSGQTLTAESMAELTHKPLYTICASELGTKASDAERNLRAIFKRVEKWNAILFLDEADLFLTKRSPTELDRNALVTVFLRNMEYFGGLMFLTTNRVEDFDPAFDSRIHLRIPFSSLEPQARSEIWRSFLPEKLDADLANRLGRELNINGREIKNLMRASQLIAKHKNLSLSESIIRDLYKANCKRQP